MPPDTISFPGNTGTQPVVDTLLGNINRVRLFWQHHHDSLEKAYIGSNAPKRPHYPLPEWQMFLLLLTIIALSAWFYIIRPSMRKKGNTITRKSKTPANQAIQEFKFDHWLSRYNPYYFSLNNEQKKRFLQRVLSFMQSKEFRFHSMVAEEYIPVLVSAAAVQLTFGLRNYLMGYFDVIHIIPKEYVLKIDKETYYGHVSKNGIYISWQRFLEGYEHYSDSENVGLHEMAHALQFDAFLGMEDKHDRSFRERLGNFSTEGRVVLRAMRKGRSQFLDDYAMTNLDELWAVSIETFFENPQEFKEKIPGLYEDIRQLLNQDPIEPDKILNKELI